jgi:hypothetical protein
LRRQPPTTRESACCPGSSPGLASVFRGWARRCCRIQASLQYRTLIMSSEGPYGRQGFQSNPTGYGGGASYGASPGAGYSPYGPPTGGGYDSVPAASYSAPSAQGEVYGASFAPYGGYQVGHVVIGACGAKRSFPDFFRLWNDRAMTRKKTNQRKQGERVWQ